ncbi:hypothetical protein GWK47_033901 [Chionoecetes opilio]|uniref:Uncharacterized protein n=1 Tax=Chionoecetes opilio TaxID=41210 RepID=A0A8J5CPC9_CHIOP|nr:hypothetical protein GWK47_033901 [Chionoecetes opilio]
MAGGVVVAVLFSLRFISVLNPASAQDCTAAVHVVEEGNVQTVYQKHITGNKKKVSTSLFVQPGTAFEGVSVEVTQQNNTKFEAWFPHDDQCYSKDATWVQLKVDVEAKTPENKTHNYLSSTTTIGNCTKTCTRYPVSYYYIRSLSVVARSSSKWNCTCPINTCLAPQVSNESPKISKCMEPLGLPTITTTPTSTPAAINASMMATSTTTVSTKLPSQSHALKITGVPSVLLSPSTVVIVLQVAVAVQVAMMVMVVVALVPWKRRCGATPTRCRAVQVAMMVMVVALVPWKRRCGATPTHTVSWRRVAPTQASSCRNSESVSENSLYEPFPGPLYTADNRSQVQINLATAS